MAESELSLTAASPHRARTIPAKRAKRTLKQADNRAGYLFLVPWLLGFFAITVIPMAASLYLSFTDYKVLKPPAWIGLDNYFAMAKDRRYFLSAWVTLRYVVISVPLVLIFSLTIAALLNRGLKGLALYRSLFYIPSLIGASVGIGMLWREVFGARGVFNAFLALFGYKGAGWMSSPGTALYTVIGLNVWTFGAAMVIFLAALRQIPEAYYEAASLDGANAWQKFRRITLPLLTPVIFFNLVLNTIGAFQSFTQAFVVSGGTGGPVDSTLLYTVYLYQRAFQQLDMGFASAMAWVLLAAIAGFTALIFWSSRFWVFYGD
ncbi:MAG TPA: sugar ABC transporter permease [Devosiaceae bacterium]|jgi:multiple sugar transport system permease protein